MSRIRSVQPNDDLRVVLCVTFDRRAAIEDISAFKRCVLDCPNVLNAAEVTGPFDFLVEVSLRDMAEYQEKLEQVAKSVAALVARYETSFVCKRYTRFEKPDQSIWVPSADGFQRIDCSLIDKVTAEGDYMRVHCGEQSWLVHTTLRSLLERLDPECFVHVHRSVVVRCDFIERLIHNDTRWSALLKDGTEQHIAKSHVGTVLETLRVGPTRFEAGSPMGHDLNEGSIRVTE